MAVLKKKRPIQGEDAALELDFEEEVAELIRGDFKSNRGQTMICSVG